jgi:hypothetical protein
MRFSLKPGAPDDPAVLECHAGPVIHGKESIDSIVFGVNVACRFN